MRRISIAETEVLLDVIQRCSGLSKINYSKVRRSITEKIKLSRYIARNQKTRQKQKTDIYYVDPCVTIEMHLFKVVFEESDTKISIVEQAFREYDPDKGYWRTLDDLLVRQMIQNEAEKSYKLVGKDKQRRYQGKPTFIDSALKFAATKLYKPNVIEKSHLRAFQNGTVNLKTGQLSAHSSDDFLTSYIPYNYVPESECPQCMLDYIASSMGIEAVDSVRAAISMILDPTAPNKFVHVVGPSGSGKGVLGRLISAMFSPESVTVDNNFKKLSEPDQRHQYLQGCSLFYIDDITEYVGGEIASFYTLVERTPMSGRSLFSSKAYNTVFNTRYLVCSTGPIPLRSSASKGLLRRAFPLPTQKISVAEDPTLETTLKEHIAEIISWALAMSKQYRNAIIANPGDYNMSTQLLLEETDLGSNSVRGFIDSCLLPTQLERHPEASITREELYIAYKEYCLASGLKALGKPTFQGQMKLAIPAHYLPKRRITKNEPGYDSDSRKMLKPAWVMLQLDPNAFKDRFNDFGESQIKIKIDSLPEGNIEIFQKWESKNKKFHPYHETDFEVGSDGSSDESQSGIQKNNESSPFECDGNDGFDGSMAISKIAREKNEKIEIVGQSETTVTDATSLYYATKHKLSHDFENKNVPCRGVSKVAGTIGSIGDKRDTNGFRIGSNPDSPGSNDQDPDPSLLKLDTVNSHDENLESHTFDV